MADFASLPPAVQWALTLIGGTGIGAFGWRLLQRGGRAEMEDALAQKFATLDALNGLGAKVTGLQHVTELANDQAESALALAQRVEQRMDFMERQVLPRMEEISRELVQMGKTSERTAGLLERLTKQVDDMERRRS